MTSREFEKQHLLYTDPEESSWTFFQGGCRNVNHTSSAASGRAHAAATSRKKDPQPFLEICTESLNKAFFRDRELPAHCSAALWWNISSSYLRTLWKALLGDSTYTHTDKNELLILYR